MKGTVLLLVLVTGVALANSTNVMVRVAGRLQSPSEIEELVVTQARRARMLFDFAGVRPRFAVLSNDTAVISMWCAQTNGSYFYATVNGRGVVQAQELMLRDAEAIRNVVARETTNLITQVWLGPDGRVGATTILSGKDEGGFFWLRRVGAKWTIYDRGTWKAIPPVLPARDFHTG